MSHELLEVRPLPVAQPTPMELISMALNQGADIDKLERLIALNDRMVAREAELAFSAAMARVQSQIRRVAHDSNNPQTRSKYASLAAIDREIRPVYGAEGFALSFDTAEAPEGMVRLVCFVSHTAGHTRSYHIDMPADGKGAKGNEVMTRTHATGSALTYGRRYLTCNIFNVAVGEDDDGNGGPSFYETETGVQELEECRSLQALQETFTRLWKAAGSDATRKRLTAAKDARKAELGSAR